MENRINVDDINIGVVGAGSWGTALANLLALKGFLIDLMCNTSENDELYNSALLIPLTSFK